MYYERNDKSEIRKILFVWGLALILMAAVPVGAQDSTVVDAVESVGEGEKIPVFNCGEDFDVRKALALLGSLTQKNIVPSPGVDGQLAFRSLRDVTFEEAMDAILGENFVYEAKGNLIKVYTKDEYKKIKDFFILFSFLSRIF